MFLVETAIEKGLQGITITDHCECDRFGEDQIEARILRSEMDKKIAEEAFGGKLLLSFGVEVGQAFYNIERIEALLCKHPFDFVLGSVHRLLYEGFDFYDADYHALTPEQINVYMEKYFEELLELVNWGKINVLAHFNYPWRYTRLQGIEVDFTRYRGHVDEVLKKAVEKGIGIELNMSGLRHNGDVIPPDWVVRRYRELGGEILTIGSDAHDAEALGVGIERGMQLLRDAGFSHFAFFRGRKPFMLRII